MTSERERPTPEPDQPDQPDEASPGAEQAEIAGEPAVQRTPDTPGETPPGSAPDQPGMRRTSETMPPVEGIYAPEGDRPE